LGCSTGKGLGCGGRTPRRKRNCAAGHDPFGAKALGRCSEGRSSAPKGGGDFPPKAVVKVVPRAGAVVATVAEEGEKALHGEGG